MFLLFTLHTFTAKRVFFTLIIAVVAFVLSALSPTFTLVRPLAFGLGDVISY